MMNETGSYPGQVWLWLYTFWYQVEPFKSSHNADALVWGLMMLLSLAFILIPFIPGVRSLPRRIPIYRLIWRDHYRSIQAPRQPRLADPRRRHPMGRFRSPAISPASRDDDDNPAPGATDNPFCLARRPRRTRAARSYFAYAIREKARAKRHSVRLSM